MKYVDIMKCPKEEKMIFGIVGGLAHYWGIEPRKLRMVLLTILLIFLLLFQQAFLMSLFYYSVSYLFTPRYEEMYDREVNPDAQPPEIF